MFSRPGDHQGGHHQPRRPFQKLLKLNRSTIFLAREVAQAQPVQREYACLRTGDQE